MAIDETVAKVDLKKGKNTVEAVVANQVDPKKAKALDAALSGVASAGLAQATFHLPIALAKPGQRSSLASTLAERSRPSAR